MTNTPCEVAIKDLIARVGIIVADNKMPFFPDFTDHGTDHINSVMRTAVDLIPAVVWNQHTDDRPVFNHTDAALLVGSSVLHDLSMHLQWDGLKELVSEHSRFQPLPWFNRTQSRRPPDLSWHTLWVEYEAEARRFSDQRTLDIVGEESSDHHWRFRGFPLLKADWTRGDYLIAGEFLRRHHARLSHEIAMYGFPGLSLGFGPHEFPSLTASGLDGTLADLVGVTARSHGMSLRACQQYLNSQYPYTPRPGGSAAVYGMALLRIADYLQLDTTRTSPLLLRLRNPLTRKSIQEWKKHFAIKTVTAANDPMGVSVQVAKEVSHSTFLALTDLLDDVQEELDHCTAVLDETYGTRSDIGLDCLQLRVRRIHSNLWDSEFLDALSYLPQDTGFSCDPRLLGLLVKPLYGDRPDVAIRELLQNAVDATRERASWSQRRGEGDPITPIKVEFVMDAKGSTISTVRVTDTGIGMSADTLVNYFLRAGASFRNDPQWSNEFTDFAGKSIVARSGRFGIGALAAFLLGDQIRVWTRHANASPERGYYVTASRTDDRVVVHRVEGLAIGTTVEIDVNRSGTNWVQNASRWYLGDWPDVQYVGYPVGKVNKIQLRAESRGNEWYVIDSEFESVHWTFARASHLACNGMRIGEIRGISSVFANAYLLPPFVSIIDNNGLLPLNLMRDELIGELSFVKKLFEDVILNVIAHALICGPRSLVEALDFRYQHPSINPHTPLHLSPVSNSEGFVLYDDDLIKALKPRTGLMRVFQRRGRISNQYSPAQEAMLHRVVSDGYALAAEVSTDNPSWSVRQLFERNKTFDAVVVDDRTGRVFRETVSSSPDAPEHLKQFTQSLSEVLDYGPQLAVYEMNVSQSSNKSTLSQFWKEILGDRPIPFDPEARVKLIAESSSKSQIARHLIAWQALGRAKFDRVDDLPRSWLTKS